MLRFSQQRTGILSKNFLWALFASRGYLEPFKGGLFVPILERDGKRGASVAQTRRCQYGGSISAALPWLERTDNGRGRNRNLFLVDRNARRNVVKRLRPPIVDIEDDFSPFSWLQHLVMVIVNKAYVFYLKPLY